jgi:hypothetical protein
MSERIDRMLGQAPDYYETSVIYQKIQAVQGDEYDSLEEKNADLKAQLRIKTATWGLRYYEETLHIPIFTADNYEVRRSRVLAKWRSPGNFSAALIKAVCESFVNGQVDVSIDLVNSMVLIKFVGPLGVPENIADVDKAVDGIIHAHLGWDFSYRYMRLNQIDQVITINELQTLKLNIFAPFTAV